MSGRRPKCRGPADISELVRRHRHWDPLPCSSSLSLASSFLIVWEAHTCTCTWRQVCVYRNILHVVVTLCWYYYHVCARHSVEASGQDVRSRRDRSTSNMCGFIHDTVERMRCVPCCNVLCKNSRFAPMFDA